MGEWDGGQGTDSAEPSKPGQMNWFIYGVSSFLSLFFTMC